ncbi:MAG TPA: efflux transporter periplasmic adaptor subunit, partial [Telluria sp.]|nr:efflux transporter periplasmic adaptor subunit [Telluria sp.]
VVRSAGAVAAGGSQTVRLLADIEGPAASLRPGMLVTALAPSPAQAQGWDLPLGALAHLGKQAYVFVRTRDGFEARRVQELSSAGQRVRVAGALAAGESVAVSGVVALKGSWLGEKGGE